MSKEEFERVYGRATVVSGHPHEHMKVVKEVASRLPGKRLLVLAGAHAQADAECRGAVHQAFAGRVVETEVVPPFPSQARIKRMIGLAREIRADGIVAVGGGSVMDTAKTVSVLAANQMSLEAAMAGDWCVEAKLPTAVIPTLFGSGSEVTPFSVLFSDEKKFSLDHPLLQPDVVGVIPRWGLLPPAGPAAAAYLDAFCQSIESLWSVKSTEESERYAWACLNALRGYATAHSIGGKYAALALASLEGGCAIGISRTTLAHALSYPLTIHHDVPHGIACAVFLAAVLCWNAAVTKADCAHPRGAEWVRKQVELVSSFLCGRTATPEQAAAEFRRLARSAGVRLSLRELGILPGDHKVIASQVGNPERLGNNPRRVTPKAIAAIIAASAEPKD